MCRAESFWTPCVTPNCGAPGRTRSASRRYIGGGAIFDSNVVREQRLDDTSVEFPRINDLRVGRPHRFGYAVHFDADAGGALVKYDLAAGSSQRAAFGPACMPGEATFVRAANGTTEDAGWRLT
jgi:carotenoid cleavage dioxygenase-like enzyme